MHLYKITFIHVIVKYLLQVLSSLRLTFFRRIFFLFY